MNLVLILFQLITKNHFKPLKSISIRSYICYIDPTLSHVECKSLDLMFSVLFKMTCLFILPKGNCIIFDKTYGFNA